MKQTFYELKEASREIKLKNKKEIVEGCTTKVDDVFIIATIDKFVSEEEAMERLAKMKSEVRFFDSIVPYYKVTEYFVEENIYDEDGSWIDGGDISGYSKLPEFK